MPVPGCTLELACADPAYVTLTAQVPSLTSGEQVTLTLTHPAVGAGIVSFDATVDVFNEVAESNEADNSAGIVLSIAEPPAPVSYTLLANRGTRIYENSGATSVIDPLETGFRTQMGPLTQHCLVGFDLSALPAGLAVESATLRLYQVSQRGYLSNGMDVYGITSPWDESSVDWYQASGSQSWSNSGGDYTAAGQTSVWIPADAGENATGTVYQWREVDVTAIVAAWLAGSPNHGLVLCQPEGAAGSIQQALFASDNPEDPGWLPQLVLEGTVSDP
jgi:hypothetical protein